MGYLDNTTVVVDAILTKKGRELLARGDGSFNITQFALSDDEIDYGLWNPNHPNGSAFSGEAIENMPIIEAFPDENQIMRNKLISLPRGTTKMPIITFGTAKITINVGGSNSYQPQTLNFNGSNALSENSGYKFTIADRRLVSNMSANGGVASSMNSVAASRFIQSTGAVSQTVVGTNLSITAVNDTSLFGTATKLLTTLYVEGLDSGARVAIPVEISKNIIGTSTSPTTGNVSV
tara:strand:+ start:41 stop:745 length:705 start_codon:yes stop_codon:yes gene_type:complete